MPVKVYKLENKHLPALWKIICTYSNFFCDDAPIKTFNSFAKWFKKINKGALVGFVNNELIGCSYFDNMHDKTGSLNIIFKKHFSVSKKIILAQRGLRYFFKKYKLKFIYGIVRMENYACIALMGKLGFIFTETLKNHKTVNGKKTDYVLGGVLYANL